MSMTQALSRVAEIRTQITTMQDSVTTPPASAASTTTSSASATDFASMLSAASATATAAGTTGAQATGLPASLDESLSSLLPQALSGTAATSGAARTTPAAAPSSGSGTGEAVVETAKKYLGTPYVWGGESLAEGGLDCSGLVYLSYSQHGVHLPRVARDMMHEGKEIGSLAEARPGDLIIQRGGKHVGLYLGDGQMIHSPRPGKTVEIASITDDRVTTIRRVVD